MEKRINQLLKRGGLVIAAGLGYGVWCRYTHLAIPCLFHKITGLYCPGCGISRMSLALLQGDFREAFLNNPGVLCVLPVLILVCANGSVRYVRTGRMEQNKAEKYMLTAVLVVLIVFGMLRNIPGLEMLHPQGRI
ncbi:DUF2752 domain-containing protein [Parasporobacterium paucivorans]|uniref:DUF2752 domain-containing protein n=1 Tax=Parasporobacterium paucivorans DSM 15970 TaxID=1122934 RepID=A0A1M6IAW3_9FIRM|nr:DUF2752 domain-containing protein [Parasporobacterium paucivorans]SHJ31609.1 Protein of unknown function [Parasporobacterium paucivorans DSM 15970]